MRVRDVMTATPAVCAPNSTLREVAVTMVRYHCGEVPIVDGGSLVGVVTDRDVTCRGIASGMDPDTATAEKVMTIAPATVSPDAEIDGAIRLMEEHRILRLPVVDVRGKLIGIISVSDIVQIGYRKRIGDLMQEVSESYVHRAPVSPRLAS